MKKLGRIFKKKVLLIIAMIVGVVLLVIFKPWEWLGVNRIRSISERVKVAMQDFGTDEKELFNLLEPLSKTDLEKVYHHFGNQNYDYGGRFWFGADIDLFGWFARELNTKEKARMKNIWAKTDLEITF